MPNGKGILSTIEDKLGLPPLSKVAAGLQQFPDMPRLRLIKTILETCERLSRTAPELEKVVALVNLIADTPTEKLTSLEKVLRRIEKIMKTAPTELLEFLSSLSLKEE